MQGPSLIMEGGKNLWKWDSLISFTSLADYAYFSHPIKLCLLNSTHISNPYLFAPPPATIRQPLPQTIKHLHAISILYGICIMMYKSLSVHRMSIS